MSQLAIVILNWNGRPYLEQFLPSVIAHSAPHRIILADNASSDDSVIFVKQHFPSVEIIQNTSNGGFAQGYNEALRQVESEYYLLLNSDIEVTPNWIDPLLDAMNSDSNLAGCQPKVRSFHNKALFEHAGAAGGFIDRSYFPFCRGRIFDQVEEDHGQYDFDTEIFWATGACMLIRAEVYHQLEGFDARFFAHMEEIDLCWRAQRLGYHFKAISSSTVYHVGGGTLSYLSPRKTFLNFRNSLLMIHKNHPRMVGAFLFRRMTLDGIAGIRFLINGQWKHLWAVFQAHMSFYRMLPSSWKERKKWKHLGNNMQGGHMKGSILFARYIQGVQKFSDLNKRLF